MDTRALKYYYRKLPDNRILFGGRGAITGEGAEDRYYADRLLSVLKTSFPSLASMNYDYAWAGWISVSLDDIPHIFQNERQDMFYSAGYCGSGVSFTAQAGKRFADKVAEKSVPDLPIYPNALCRRFHSRHYDALGSGVTFNMVVLKIAYLIRLTCLKSFNITG